MFHSHFIIYRNEFPQLVRCVMLRVCLYIDEIRTEGPDLFVPEESVLILTRLDNEVGVGTGTVLAVKTECIILIAKAAAENVRAGRASKIRLIPAR